MVKNFIVITVISIAFIIYMLIQQEWAYAGILVGILALYYLLTLGMQKLTTNRMLKRSPLVDNPMTQTYVFLEESFSVTNVKSYNVDYKDIQTVKRAKDFYMIQTSDRKTYIVDFKGFEKEEDIFTLGNFFNQKLNLKMKLQ
jgi:ABC-type bacteriocin/lantibiotic exporter with double-glycine peptidase domain